MEARLTRSVLSVATVFLLLFSFNSVVVAQIHPQQQFVANSQNFIVFASSPQWASQVSQVAEEHRRNLAMHWLGQELPAWPERCPVHVTAARELGAGGETRFSLLPHGAGNWMMSVQGTPERILDSVLPHEISHTIFATYFASLGKYVPRWADEGACTTVEHESEKRKHRAHLTRFLQTGHGLSFNRMFSLKEYPDPILPLYAQGHSVVQFLIDQGGPQKFIQFIQAGMETEAWERVLREYYAYSTIGEFQTMWNKWLLDGSPSDLSNYAPGLKAAPQVMLAASEDSQQDTQGKFQLAIGHSGPPPVTLASDATTQWSHQQPDSQSQLGNESWYKRRLREASLKRAVGRVTSLDQDGTTASGTQVTGAAKAQPPISLGQSANVEPKSMSRPQAMQTPSVHVLEWGSSIPVPGIASPGRLNQPNDPASPVILQAGTPIPVQMVPIQR